MPDFPWAAFMAAVQQKNKNQQDMYQNIGQTANDVGNMVGQQAQRQRKLQAQQQFGQAFSNASSPVQGPPTQEGGMPQQPPVDIGKMMGLVGQAFPGSEGQVLPSLIKEFGKGPDSKEALQQDKLEQQYKNDLNKGLSFRSGGLGLQDAKVNQAIDLRTMINQTYDPATGKYNIPPSLHSELVLGLARLVSPTGQVGVELMHDLQQKTLREGVAGSLIYLGLADPKTAGGPTQDVAKLFIDSIDRQGETAEKLRDKYMDGIRQRAPSRLDSKRREYLEKSELGSSFVDLLHNSPSYKAEKRAAAGGGRGGTPAPKSTPPSATLRWNPKTGALEPVK